MELPKRGQGERGGTEDGLLLVGAMVAVMWISEVVDTILDHRLDSWGIEPREVDGLSGIVASPFLHAGFDHLIGNTIPFAVMGAAIAFNGAARVAAVTLIVGLIAGGGTWLVAPAHTEVIGASGIVFGYASYLISRGFFARSLWQLAVGAIVIAVWGTALLYSLAPHPGVSWQAHLFGAIGGVVAAYGLTQRDRARVGDGAPRPGRVALP